MVLTDKPSVTNTVIFSLVDGTVWASWPGKSTSVELGHCDGVTFMMRDFLAQCDLGERLTRSKASNN